METIVSRSRHYLIVDEVYEGYPVGRGWLVLYRVPGGWERPIHREFVEAGWYADPTEKKEVLAYLRSVSG